MASDTRITTGQSSFEYGVDSSKVPLVQSSANPNGLPRNALAWGDNITVRGGGIKPRSGFQPLCRVHDGSALYQGGWLYDNGALDGFPYLMLSIGGRMFQVRVDTDNSIKDVTGVYADPATAPQAYFVQGERFMVKQSGDGVTLPLFWDGVQLRRSNGILGPGHVPFIGSGTGLTPFNELPAATSMCYYMGRIWYAQNRKFTAGDIVDNTFSGTLQYNFDDSILKVTENPLALGGDGFSLPAQAGNVRALTYPIALDQTLGQGPLFVVTPKQIYSLTVPVTRADWIAADTNNQPLLAVVMNTNGGVSERGIVPVNGDLFYPSLEPAIRSFFMALRYFQTWGNGVISNNLNRVMQFNDRSLMHVTPGISFQNRLLMGILPQQSVSGIVFKSIAVLDLDPVSTLQDQKPPAWEGMLEGINVLQLFEGDFGGRQRAFAVVVSQVDGSIQVWEITTADKFDNQANSPLSTGDKRIQLYCETPSLDYSEYPAKSGGGTFALKELDGLDLWLDSVFGDVIVNVQFRPDEDACWHDWATIKVCSARNTCEDSNSPVCYPTSPAQTGYRMPLAFPKPTNTECSTGNNRPATQGYKFQLRFNVTGYARIRGYHLHALPKDATPFYNMICTPQTVIRPIIVPAPTPPPPPGPPPPPVTSKISAYWPFEESSGDYFDKVAAYDIPRDKLLTVTGLIGAAAGMPPITNYSGVPALSGPTYNPVTSTGFSVWFWYKYTDVAHNATFVDITIGTGYYVGNYLDVFVESRIPDDPFQIGIYGAGSPAELVINQTLTPNVWHFIGAVWDNVNHLFKVYVDNNPVQTGSDTGMAVDAGIMKATIQSTNQNSQVQEIDEFGMCITKSLTDAQMLALYNSGNGVTWPGVKSII